MIKTSLLLVIGIFAALQFFRPEKPGTTPAAPTANDFLVRRTPPPVVREMLRNACYDCHSNQTRYPWYTEIQPAGWFMAQHIRDGKRVLNFSEFERLPAKRMRKKLENCIDVVSEHEMPLKSYTLIHRDARLNDEQIKTFVAWAEDEIRKISTSSEKPE